MFGEMLLMVNCKMWESLVLLVSGGDSIDDVVWQGQCRRNVDCWKPIIALVARNSL